ncbi:hypothetical protein QUG18_26175, partial [Escherichia coli]|nr:hypothetical protein [Escherichia coli]
EARANLALAEAVSAQQNVETTRQTAEADRAKQVALIAAAQDAICCIWWGSLRIYIMRNW